jgi:hypothetical protein
MTAIFFCIAFTPTNRLYHHISVGLKMATNNPSSSSESYRYWVAISVLFSPNEHDRRFGCCYPNFDQSNSDLPRLADRACRL